jgi:hypothetical protein
VRGSPRTLRAAARLVPPPGEKSDQQIGGAGTRQLAIRHCVGTIPRNTLVPKAVPFISQM